MPLIVIACERLELSLPNVNNVPFDPETIIGRSVFIRNFEEERIAGNYKEPSYTLKGALTSKV